MGKKRTIAMIIIITIAIINFSLAIQTYQQHQKTIKWKEQWESEEVIYPDEQFWEQWEINIEGKITNDKHNTANVQ